MDEKTAGDYKTCPIKQTSSNLFGGPGGYVKNSELCTETECAWWDVDREKCGVLTRT